MLTMGQIDKETAIHDIYRLAVRAHLDLSNANISQLINCYCDAMSLLLLKCKPLTKMQLHYISNNVKDWTNKPPTEIISCDLLLIFLLNNKEIRPQAFDLYLRNVTYLIDEYQNTLDAFFVLSIRNLLKPFFELEKPAKFSM
jgi:hypothetical protein